MFRLIFVGIFIMFMGFSTLSGDSGSIALAVGWPSLSFKCSYDMVELNSSCLSPEPEQVYTCEGVSALGRKVGSTLTAKFACKFRMMKMSLPVPFSKKSSAQNTPSFIDAKVSIFTVVRMRAI